jgi:hypothetical protein
MTMKMKMQLMAMMAATLGLAACGGGGSGEGDGAGNNPPIGSVITKGVASVKGEWLQIGCVAAGGQSFKKTLRATETTPTSIDYYEGVLSFTGTTCAGAGTQVGPSLLGNVVFSRSESNSTIAANWGEFTTITTTKSAVIWAKNGEATLCLLGDSTPSIQPTLANVASSLATNPNGNCFAKRV